MENLNSIIDTIYKNRDEFILLGLTGRIGSGCTTAAKFLSQTKDQHNLKEVCINDDSSDAQRKKYILWKFYRKKWKPFEVITMSDIITIFIFKYSYKNLKKIIEEFNTEIKNQKIKRFKNFDEINFTKLINEKDYENLRKEYINLLTEIKEKRTIKEKLKNFWKASKKFKDSLQKQNYKNYTDLYQLCGDNIRLYGDIKINEKNKKAKNIYTIADITNKIIKIYRKETKPTYIVLDAIRNILEAYFFKERYSAFYLIAIDAPNEDIKNRLSQINPSLSKKQIEKMLSQEDKELETKSLEDFISQNIKSCIVNSDIFIRNEGKNINDDASKLELYGNLIKYVSLIQHPGLITPSNDEKMMQIAFTAKLNSGCISRQVGACVTNKYGSIKAIGWNDVAEGQTSCVLRSASELLKNSISKAYSHYEKTLEFKEFLKKEYVDIKNIYEKGLNDSYCFKTIYTRNKEKQKNNQVHTRALHAEENAFLQLAKYGSGESIIGGTLYTTASPCELCSKKAYQLGISRIVYIDPYPGIAKENILYSGLNPPKVEFFNGAIGTAYHKLYTQIIPYKDEINSLKEIING